MKVMALRLILLSGAVSGLLSLNAVGQLSMPYTNTFEGYSRGYPIASESGWYIADGATDSAFVTNSTGCTNRSDFFPRVASPSNVLSIAGTVSNAFLPNTPDYIYIDVCIKPQFRNKPPFEAGVTPAPMVAVYVNSESNLVFYHTSWIDPSDPLNDTNARYVGNETWSTNDRVVISSTNFVRLTFEILNDNAGFGDSFYRVWVNGNTNNLPANSLSYNTDNLLGIPANSGPEPRTWFMTANSDGGLTVLKHGLNSFTVNGYAEMDDFYAATTRTFVAPPPETGGYSSNGVPYLWLDSLTNDFSGDYNAADIGDSDHDGVPNWQEYWAGTDPRNSTSFFKIVSVNTNGSGITLTWMGGTNDVNPYWVIYRTTNLLGNPNTLWTNDINLPATNVVRAAARVNSMYSRWADTNDPTRARMFYRLTTTTNAPN